MLGIIITQIQETYSQGSQLAESYGITSTDHTVALLFGLSMFCSAIILFFVPAPYGKFNNSLQVPFLTAKVVKQQKISFITLFYLD